MARCTLSGLITSISGSVGDVTFSRWKNIVRVSKKIGKTRNAVVSSSFQSEVRAIISELSRSWRALSFTDKVLWESYAKEYGNIFRNRSRLIPGSGRNVTGNSAYLSINAILLRSGFSAISKPVLCKMKHPRTVMTDLVDLGEYSKELRFNIWLPSSYKERCVCQIWVSVGGSRGYPYLHTVIPVSTQKSLVVIDNLRWRKQGRVVEKSLRKLEWCNLLLQFRTVAENGLFSVPSGIYRVEVKQT